MTDIFLAFSLLFIFIIVGFWIMSKIDRFINSLRDKLQKDDAMEDDNTKGRFFLSNFWDAVHFQLSYLFSYLT